MPRFHFHVHNGTGESRDDEGRDVASHDAARELAIRSVRSIAEEALVGMIDLNGHIEIRDAADALVMQVAFIDAFDLRLPDRYGGRE